jgi:uncharacterized protein (TIGR02284 family)
MDTIPALVTDPTLQENVPLPVTDASELQEVLTRYVDSRDGYLQAATLVPSEGLAGSFRAIAERREAIAGKVADLIAEQGLRADFDGSPEASLHRWWIRLKEKMTEQDVDAVLNECIRGEEELERTLESALESGKVGPGHQALIREALSEVQVAIRSFRIAVDD